MEITLVQTLQDKGNYPYVETEGPFKCTRPHAWLGYGYYFWDTHIDLGHWWGQHVYGHGKYMICEANGIIDKNCWDLHGNQRHLSEFNDICNEIIESKTSTREKLKVPEVIEFAKKFREFNYQSIRALGSKSISQKDDFFNSILFQNGKYSYLDLLPPVQICLIIKTALSLTHYRVVFPEDFA